MHIQGCTHTQERPEKTLSCHFWLILRHCRNRKWRLRHNCKLPRWVLKACSNMYKEPLSKDWFQVFKTLHNHEPTTKLIEQISVATCTKEYRVYRTSSEKDTKQNKQYYYNKQQHQNQEGKEWPFQSCHILTFKMFSFQQKITKHAKK